MNGSIVVSAGPISLRQRMRRWLAVAQTRPEVANRVLLAAWSLTRFVLVLGMLLGAPHNFSDSEFYKYAGLFAQGKLPYKSVPVEYPPLAMLLLLLPALPLLLFKGIAPRPDPAFQQSIHTVPLPHDLVRYSAYGVSFAVEMLLLDIVTLWLVRRVASKATTRDPFGLWSGLLYIALVFCSGALLQKFDLAAGTLCLAAILALITRHPKTAWALLALATLVKGYPLLAAPVFALYGLRSTELESASCASWWMVLKRLFRQGSAGVASFLAVLATVTLGVMLWAGWPAVTATVLYHAARGTEIESFYANVMLALGWIPGLAVSTTFSADGLAREIVSPLNQALWLDALAAVLLVVLLLIVVLGVLRSMVHGSWRSSLHFAHHDDRIWSQIVLCGTAASLLAFMLAFRALPAHYLLDVLPLVALIRLPQRRTTAFCILCVAGVGLVGQMLAIPNIWHGLVELEPWAVGVLTLRNALWAGAFAVLVAGIYGWSRVPAFAQVTAPDRPRSSAPPPGKTALRQPRGLRAWRKWLEPVPPLPGFTPRGEDFFAHLLAQVAPERLVVGSGVLSLLVYVGFALAFPITRLWDQPHAGADVQAINDIGRITGYSPLAASLFVAAILLLFGCQFIALIGAARVRQVTAGVGRVERIVQRSVLLFPIAFAALMIWMQPVTTTDLYGYVARGYLYAHFHLNPMTHPATALPGGLAVNRPAAPYGPAWLLLAGGIAQLTGENLLANMLCFKFIGAVSAIIALLLVDRLALRLYPERRLRVDILFGWSPLLIFESVGNGHNDIVMMVFVLLAFALMLRQRSRLAFTCLVLGALVKYVSAVFVLLWLVYTLRHLVRREGAGGGAIRAARPQHNGSVPPHGATGGPAATLRSWTHVYWQTFNEIDRWRALGLLASVTAIGAVLTAAFYAPFWHGIQTFKGLGQQVRPLYYNDSPIDFFTAPLRLLLTPGQDVAFDKTIRLLLYVLFVIYILIQARRLWLLGPRADMRDMLTASAKVTFAALLLITFWFQPWYIVWLLPLAALSRESFIRRQATLFAAGALMTYAVGNFLFVGEQGLGQDLFVQFFEILVTYVPLLVLRAAPYEQGWFSILRSYADLFGEGIFRRPLFWQRLTVGLILLVAALLRMLLLGNLFLQLSAAGSGSGTLKAVSADLRLFASDPQGLSGPIGAVQQGLVYVFGTTPLAFLLPSAIIGTLTVLLIYLLAREIMRQGQHQGIQAVALLAALLAATSRWHVSLSRSGVEIVLLPFLVCLALYWLLLAFRLGAPAMVVERAHTKRDGRTHSPSRQHERARRKGARRSQRTAQSRVVASPSEASNARRCLWLYAGCGACTGLACDLAPGLWLLPILVTGFFLVWRWREPHWFASVRARLLTLIGTACIFGVPVLGYYLSRAVGFPQGSAVLARTSDQPKPGPGLFSLDFWGQVGHNFGDVLRLLASQDYSAGYPAVGNSPIIPIILTPFFFLGVAIILIRWRNPGSLALMLLIALSLVASVAVGTPSSVIEAACVLPAICIVPALALYETGVFLGHLPIVLDRMNGVRIFSTPEQIGRIVLLLFLVVSAIRTFFWYFEATLPAQPLNPVQTPSYIGSPIVRMAGPELAPAGNIRSQMDGLVLAIRGTELSISPAPGIVHVHYVRLAAV